MTYSVEKGLLFKDGKPVAQKISPNRGGALVKPTLLVMHYTASQSAKGAISWLCDRKAKASAHLVIDESGVVTQLVAFDRVAWHAGKSRWGLKSNCNSFSIGIELSNPGPLVKRGDGKFADAYGGAFPADRVAMLAHKFDKGAVKPWAIYPKPQIDAAVGIAQALCATYGIKDIAGHDDIAPSRKRDPGPVFNMASFVARVFGRA